jgi:mannan endo-1,4-beta-mannosidase
MARPAGNTGVGFYVVGSKLYDANGVEFRIRGLNHLHWDAPGVGIPKTGANTERWVLDFGQSAATNAGLLQRSTTNRMVPMPGNWDGTCTEDTATLTGIVDTWVAQASRFKPFERSTLVNIANEWGPDDSTVWRDSYTTAVARMRTAGYLGTIAVDAGGCGQGVGDILHYARAVFDSDPQRNLVFDFHAYGFLCTTACESWQFPLAATFDAFAAAGLPIVIGEFGPGRSIGPSPTGITPVQIIQAAEARGFGWLAWAFDDPAGEFTSPPVDNWFALSFTGDYRTSADLTTFGKAVVPLMSGPKASIF